MLIKCIECNHDISEYAERCPKCGCLIDKIEKNLCAESNIDFNDFEIDKNILKRYIGNSTKVIIPDGVTSINSNAFSRCINCKEIYIPKTVDFIGGAFAELSGEIVYTVSETFANCKNLERIIVDEDNKKYSSYDGMLFNKERTVLLAYPCAGKQEISIPEGVIEIGYEAFKGSHTLFKVFMPNCVKRIGESAFSKCEKLKEINLSNNLQKLGIGAFSGCTNLVGITIPGNLEIINIRTFEHCSNLEHVKIETGVECVWNFAFAGCKKIEKITLPSSVTEIGSSAFCACLELKEIFIPRSVYAIYEEWSLWASGEAFEGCEKLLICCEHGSYAQRYAISHNIKYSLITG